jgi:hypothetical protein
MPEPVSPELVLVDPELAARERARLIEGARLQSILNAPGRALALELATSSRDGETSTGAVPEVPSRRHASFVRQRVLPAALLCSLLANGAFAAELVTRADTSNSAAVVPVAVRPASITEVTAAISSGATSTGGVAEARVSKKPAARDSTRTTDRARAVRQHVTRKGVVERKLVSLMLAAPPKRLPSTFVDSATGLIKNNVRVVCRAREKSSFLCVVQLPTDPPGHGLYVRYRGKRNGKGVFSWYGYRSHEPR